jgi:hypothetical protein
MGIMEMLKGAETKKEITAEDLISFGGFKTVSEGLSKVHPLMGRFNKDETLNIVNDAGVTLEDLKELSEVRDLEQDEQKKLDYKEKFYDIRQRLDKAISKAENKEEAA